MNTIQIQYDIDRSPADVFAYLTDFSQLRGGPPARSRRHCSRWHAFTVKGEGNRSANEVHQ